MSFVHDFPFDPTGGYTPEQLLKLKVELTEPEDFTCFWLDTHEWALTQPLRWTIRPSASHPGDAQTEVFDIEFDSLLGDPRHADPANSDGNLNGGNLTGNNRHGVDTAAHVGDTTAHAGGRNRIGGWLTKPRGREAKRGVVIGHGYGGREAPDLSPYLPADADAVTIQPVLSGQPTRSFYPQLGIGTAACPHHVLYGIDRRETYIHRFCAMDICRAASVLHEAVPQIRYAELNYIGESFGGGMGAMALAWDKRFTRAHLGVPSFGNHPLRLQIPCTGSGEFVRHYAQKYPHIVRDVLPYFDSALHARHIKIPVHVECAFFDPAVTPVGQFSVYHSLGGAKQLFAASSGHFEHAGTAAEKQRVREATSAFFA